ncbi:MAG TPA: hypothetical protein VJ809_06220 [Pirellulales bacterium]|jgi:hypothetical protein|nr:hypothetical protein [Pirellulales bacterium]
MQWLQQVIRDNFLLLWAAAVAWCIGGMAFLLWRRSRRGPHFPDRDEVNVLFKEKWTSGRSCKSLFTRLGGANNCLRVVVTDNELWIAPHFPFSAFAGQFDLDHRISRDVIKNIEQNGRKVTVEFAVEECQTRKVELRLRNPDAFVTAIESPISVDK